MRLRALDYPWDEPVEALGPAAIENILDRGDLADWARIARAVAADPAGSVAETVLSVCRAHPTYGVSNLWRIWIERRRRPATASLAELRRRRGITQETVGARLGIHQSDVSKLERRGDLRVSTLRAYLAALGAQASITAHFDDDAVAVELRPPGTAAGRGGGAGPAVRQRVPDRQVP